MNCLKLKKYFFIIEPYFFVLFLAYSLYPFFAVSTFPVSDAPAHLYNSGLIDQLLIQKNEFLQQYFSFNHKIIPNWTSHFILSILLNFFTPEASEKIILVIIFAGLPLAFRYFLQALNKERGYLAFLVVPISYNCYAGMGFYNFALGLVFMSLSAGFFYKKILPADTKWYHYFIFMLLLLITYFSHIVTITITLLFVFFIFMWSLMHTYGSNWKGWLNKKSLVVIICVFPVIFLGYLYMTVDHPGNSSYTYLEGKILLEYFKSGRFFVVYGQLEEMGSSLLALCYIFIFFISAYQFLNAFNKNFYTDISFYLLTFILMLLLMYVTFPDGDQNGGYFSLRLVVITFLFIIALAGVSGIKNRYFLAIIPLVICIHVNRLDLYKSIAVQNNKNASLVLDQAVFIEKNSFIVPFDHTNNWLYASFNNYLGINRSTVCLFNYECYTKYFPLVWKDEAKIISLRSNLEGFKNLEKCKSQLGNRPIYYWIAGPIDLGTDSVAINFRHNLENKCILLNSNNFASLYKLK